MPVLQDDLDILLQDYTYLHTACDGLIHAIEYFYYNVEGSYVGEQTPIWIYSDEGKDILLEESPRSNLRIYKGEA